MLDPIDLDVCRFIGMRLFRVKVFLSIVELLGLLLLDRLELLHG